MKVVFRIILLLITLIMSIPCFAQEGIDKEIIVVKPYVPTLSDAQKINILPEIIDTVSVKPHFNYVIQPKKFETGYELRPIKAARLVGEPLEKLYKSYLRLGVGNYLVPLAELNVNSLRSRDQSFGLYLKHNSINGKLKLDNDQKVPVGFNENIIHIWGKKIFRNAELSGMLSPEFYGLNFYGYNPEIDTVLTKEEKKQNYLFADASMRMRSTHDDSLHLNYDLKMDYGFTYDHFEHHEHAIRISSDMNKLFENNIYGLKASAAHYRNSSSIDTVNNTIIQVNPWFSKATSEYTYKLGVNVVADIYGDDPDFFVHPIAFLQIKVVDKIMIPYFGIEGKLQENHFGKIARENMYIVPGLHVANTNHKINAYIGIKGNYTSRLSYHLNFNYSLVDQMYFFINDTNDILGNKFLVAYDDIERINAKGEFIFKPNDKLNFALKGNFYRYNLDSLEYAWHKPEFDLMLFGEYNLQNKIFVKGNLFYVGSRYAMNPLASGNPVKLDGYLDLSVGLEYRYTKILSAFIQLNNLLGMDQNPWLFYPSMRFNFLVGFTYSL
jgi:hypothetical protein